MKFGTFVRIGDLSEVEQKFKTVRDAGFTACQVVYKPKEYIMEDAKIIRDAADKYGIDISAQFCGQPDNETIWDIYYGYATAGLNIEAYRESRVTYIKKACEFAKELGTTDCVIHAGYVPNNPFAPEYATMLTSVYAIGTHCKNLGLNLLFETGGESPITLLRMMEDVGLDNLYINFDPANIMMYGYGNPVDALKVFGKRVRNFHGKDGNLPTDTRHLGKEMPAGQGMVDFPTIFKMFRELGYDRYCIIEREITGEQQMKDICAAKDYFEKLV